MSTNKQVKQFLRASLFFIAVQGFVTVYYSLSEKLVPSAQNASVQKTGKY